MSRVLLICFMLVFASHSAFAQVPEPGSPPQISQTITVSSGGDSDIVFFGLDLRATDDYDDDPGLVENANLPPWSLAVEARFLRPDNSYTDRDYRLGQSPNTTVTHTLEFQRSDGDDTSPVVLSWDFDDYVTADIVERFGQTVVGSMSGSGTFTIPQNASGVLQYQDVDLVVTYTDITELLPVELTSFDALLSGNSAVLSWETSSELNNAGFEVQQSVNGEFAAIGFVAGNGTTDEAKSYGFTTGALAAGTHSFRLKQIDFDGAFAYSDVVSVQVALDSPALLSKAYPNPFNPQTQFTLTIARQQNVTIQVYDMLGRQVQTLYQGDLAPSEAHQFTFQASDLPSGRYFIRAVGEYFNNTQTVTLLK